MSVTDALKQKVAAMAESAKIADLQHDITKPEQYLTTDHGVKVAETDNWYVDSIHTSSSSISETIYPVQRLKAQDGTHTGPSLLEDQVQSSQLVKFDVDLCLTPRIQIGREKIMRFDHERIPERVVHARGAGAFGHFKVFDDSAKKYTFAPVLTDSSRTTPVFVRFSTVQGSRGSAVSAVLTE